ncbi:MAG: hypothetical protein ACFE8Z_07045 [Candidatus Hermodarchaeota archaeon]
MTRVTHEVTLRTVDSGRELKSTIVTSVRTRRVAVDQHVPADHTCEFMPGLSLNQSLRLWAWIPPSLLSFMLLSLKTLEKPLLIALGRMTSLMPS